MFGSQRGNQSAHEVPQAQIILQYSENNEKYSERNIHFFRSIDGAVVTMTKLLIALE